MDIDACVKLLDRHLTDLKNRIYSTDLKNLNFNTKYHGIISKKKNHSFLNEIKISCRNVPLTVLFFFLLDFVLFDTRERCYVNEIESVVCSVVMGEEEQKMRKINVNLWWR